jgi:hypothetical protein
VDRLGLILIIKETPKTKGESDNFGVRNGGHGQVLS